MPVEAAPKLAPLPVLSPPAERLSRAHPDAATITAKTIAALIRWSVIGEVGGCGETLGASAISRRWALAA